MVNETLIQAITLDDDIAKITVPEVPDQPGIAFKLFSAISDAGIRIDSIVQNVNRSNINDITFTVAMSQAELAKSTGEEFAKDVGAKEIICDDKVAKLSVIGSGMVTSSKVASRFFKALFEAGANIQMISTSEVKISCVIDKDIAKTALKQVYKEFEMI